MMFTRHRVIVLIDVPHERKVFYFIMLHCSHLEELFQLLARSFSQLEMVRLAKASNVIVKLDTGAGKTFIASMLMQHMLPQTKASLSEGGKRIVFLVKTGKSDKTEF